MLAVFPVLLPLAPIAFPLAGVMVGFGLTKATGWVNKKKVTKTLLKSGPAIAKIYDVLDPILADNLSKWDGSQVEDAFSIAVRAIADGKLTDKEVKDSVAQLAQSFLPQAAADKVRTYSKYAQEPVEVTASKVVGEAVTGLLTSEAAVNQVKNILGKS
jgi:hypothetical protein